jgi:calcium binding protein 39
MLRECCRYEELTKLIITSEQFYKFFEYVELSTFDIASDAFLTFRVSLMFFVDCFLSNFFPSIYF